MTRETQSDLLHEGKPNQRVDVREMKEQSYKTLLDIARSRSTNRAFQPDYAVPGEHYEQIIEVARHAPSGANAQPWHYIVVRQQALKDALADCFKIEQRNRARLKMKFPTPNYEGLRTAPGLIVVVADFRFTRAFPVLNDGSETDRMYQQNAERILLQSVACSVMSAHLAAAALGYAVWWVTAIGQEAIQQQFKPMLDVPEALYIIDLMAFGPPLKPSYHRFKRELTDVMSWDRFDPAHFLDDDELDQWIKSRRHRVMYRDGKNVD